MSEYVWLNDMSQAFMERDYLEPGQTVDERVRVICKTAERILGKKGFAGKLRDYIKRGWYSLSTPIWTNFGTDRGLPISCFGSYVDDSMESLLYTHAEIGMMTKYGGGTSAYLGPVRKRGSLIRGNGESAGSVHFAQMYDKEINIVSQGRTRRGNCAIYQDIDHGDIHEFLSIRSDGHPVQDLFPGVCVSDEWLESMIAKDVGKREVWARVLESRCNTGLPYIFFKGNANRDTVDVYKDLGLTIEHSNLCTEIMLPNGLYESFVCDLSSMNDLYYDDWKDTDAVEVIVYLLDAVMTEFINKASKIPFMQRPVNFARRHRALGLGQLGWHSYLQSKMIPWETMQAKHLNVEVARTIKEQSYAASRKLAREYGEPEYLKGYGRRNSTLIALAPTTSSSFIIRQVSKSIEPETANYYIKDLAKGKFTYKNPYLEALLRQKGMDTPPVWTDIMRHGGSVQHLERLTEQEKAVFKTFQEISPREIIIQAAQRQKHIDQGQSLNLMIPPDVPASLLNALTLEAWELGLKSLYYQFSVNAAQSLGRNILACSSCSA